MKQIKVALAIMACLAGLADGLAQKACAAAPKPAVAVAPKNPYANPDPQKYLFENKLKPGMTGYGLTVMHGTKIQKFRVKIVDVMSNFQPDMNVILVRCSGLGLSKSGIIEGMSGSPVYIDGKLIGAIAYGWDFSRYPLGGVQPIRQMLHIPLPPKGQAAPGGGAGGKLSWVERTAIRHPMAGWSMLVRHIGMNMGVPAWQLRPDGQAAKPLKTNLRQLATPLEVGGASPAVLSYLRRAFHNSSIVPVGGGAAGGGVLLGGMQGLPTASYKLVPGAALGVPLLTGDTNMGAIGTVTDVVGDHVYAFGHRFFNVGPNGLPISGAYIYTIVARLQTSFKLGSTFHIQGHLLMDQSCGIVGTLAPPAKPVPVVVSVTYHNPSWSHVFHYNLYPNPHTTVEALGGALIASMTAKRNITGKNAANYTVHITGTADFGKFSIPINRRATTGTFDPNAILLPIALLINNPFHNLAISGMHLHISLWASNHSAVITSVTLEHRTVRPGKFLVARVAIKPYHEKTRYRTVRLRVPADTPNGNFDFVVGADSSALAQQQTYFPQYFSPNSIGELKRDVLRIVSYQNNHIYARLVLNAHGVADTAHALPNLPASRIDILTRNPGRPLFPLFNTVGTELATPWVVSVGGQEFQVMVRRQANGPFFLPKPPVPPGFPGMPGNP